MNKYDRDGTFFWFLIIIVIAALLIYIIGTPEEKQTAKDVEDNVIADEIVEGLEEAAEVAEIKPLCDYYLPECELSPQLQKAVYNACNDTGIPFGVALGLIEVESEFNPYAVNAKSGCYGLCQLHPKYFPTDLSPEENIETGIKYLARIYGNNGGDMEKALTIYYAGHDNGSRRYAKKVLQAAAIWDEYLCNEF